VLTRVVVSAALLASAALTGAGCGGPSDAIAAKTAAAGYLSADGPELCAYLGRDLLASYAGAGGETPLAACRAASRITLGDGDTADVVEHVEAPEIASVEVDGNRAFVHGLRGPRSVELELVREGGSWLVAVDDEAVRDDETLVGVRFSPTEEAVFNALLFGPNDGDTVALRRVEALTRSYVALVRSERALDLGVKRAKLRWAIGLTADGSCDSCAAILRRALADLGE
jgi:hypothetical protein